MRIPVFSREPSWCHFSPDETPLIREFSPPEEREAADATPGRRNPAEMSLRSQCPLTGKCLPLKGVVHRHYDISANLTDAPSIRDLRPENGLIINCLACCLSFRQRGRGPYQGSSRCRQKTTSPQTCPQKRWMQMQRFAAVC